MVREEFTDAQWEQLRPLLPPQAQLAARGIRSFVTA
jgi:transposase